MSFSDKEKPKKQQNGRNACSALILADQGSGLLIVSTLSDGFYGA
jgi:hypothetical protein